MKKKELSSNGTTNKKSKKKIIIGAVVAIVILAALTSPSDETDNTVPESTTQTQKVASENTTAASDLPEPNTSAMVDSIAMKAKEDAKNATEEKRNEYTQLIVDNYPNFYESNELMEQLMYAGCYLEYGFSGTTYEKLGMDTNQAIKYVYRNAEKPEDQSTQENLKQIKDSLNEIGYRIN